MSIKIKTKSASEILDTCYAERKEQLRKLKEEGRVVIGYFCCFVPLEFFTALDIVPYRIQGSVTEPLTLVDAHLEPIMCPYIRSCFDLALKSHYEFLDGLVVPHSCDTVTRIYAIWTHASKLKYHHFINVPHMIGPSSYEFFKRELGIFITSLEKFTGKRLTQERLLKAIRLHNENRALLREFYALRKEDPPLVSGTEAMKLLIVGMGMPVEEHNALVKQVTAEIKATRPKLTKKSARILIHGNEIDDIAFIKLVEDSGAHVVMDDLCTGSRTFWYDVKNTKDPLDSIVNRYLEKIPCPRTYRPKGETRQKDLENRFEYLKMFIRDFKVNGVIQYVIRYCDTYELEAPDVKEYLQGMAIPVLYLEDDYSLTTIGQLRTRVQAFLEVIT